MKTASPRPALVSGEAFVGHRHPAQGLLKSRCLAHKPPPAVSTTVDLVARRVPSCGCRKPIQQAIFVDHTSGTVAPLDPELIQVGDAIGQPAQRRGMAQDSVRPVPIVEVLVLAQHDHQMPRIPCQGPVQQLMPAAADRAFRSRQTRLRARPAALSHSELMAQHKNRGVLPPPFPPRQAQQRHGAGDKQEVQLHAHKPKIIPHPGTPRAEQPAVRGQRSMPPGDTVLGPRVYRWRVFGVSGCCCRRRLCRR